MKERFELPFKLCVLSFYNIQFYFLDKLIIETEGIAQSNLNSSSPVYLSWQRIKQIFNSLVETELCYAGSRTKTTVDFVGLLFLKKACHIRRDFQIQVSTWNSFWKYCCRKEQNLSEDFPISP